MIKDYPDKKQIVTVPLLKWFGSPHINYGKVINIFRVKDTIFDVDYSTISTPSDFSRM